MQRVIEVQKTKNREMGIDLKIRTIDTKSQDINYAAISIGKVGKGFGQK